MTQNATPNKNTEEKTLCCSRCGYRWNPKYPGAIPRTCGNPKCRSPRWNVPKGERKPYTWKSAATKEAARRKPTKKDTSCTCQA